MTEPDSHPGWLSTHNSADDYTVPAPGGGIGLLVADRVQSALRQLSACVEVHPDKRGSVPVLAGTRFTLAQLLAELAEGDRSVSQIVEDFDLDGATVRAFLEGLAFFLDRPVLP